jgi:hypothetical protein
MPRFRRPFSVRRPNLTGFPHFRKLRKKLPQITLNRGITRLPLTQGGECRLASAYAVQEPDRVERSALGFQRFLELVRDSRVGQQAIARRRRGEIGLLDLCPFPHPFAKLEGRLKEVHVEANSLEELSQNLTGDDSAQTIVAHHSADNRTVLLFNPGLIVLLVHS